VKQGLQVGARIQDGWCLVEDDTTRRALTSVGVWRSTWAGTSIATSCSTRARASTLAGTVSGPPARRSTSSLAIGIRSTRSRRGGRSRRGVLAQDGLAGLRARDERGWWAKGTGCTFEGTARSPAHPLRGGRRPCPNLLFRHDFDRASYLIPSSGRASRSRRRRRQRGRTPARSSTARPGLPSRDRGRHLAREEPTLLGDRRTARSGHLEERGLRRPTRVGIIVPVQATLWRACGPWGPRTGSQLFRRGNDAARHAQGQTLSRHLNAGIGGPCALDLAGARRRSTFTSVRHSVSAGRCGSWTGDVGALRDSTRQASARDRSTAVPVDNLV
jgi:hypothetical protein